MSPNETNMDVICFANDWEGDPLSKKHLMRGLARRGCRVLWVSSLGNRAPRLLADAKDRARLVAKAARFVRGAFAGPRAVEENVWVIDPIAAPLYGSALAARANGAIVGAHVRSAAARLGFRDPIHYTFVPASAWVAGKLGERAIVYHAADEYAAFGGADERAIRSLESELLGKCDLYVACSAPLLAGKSARRSMLLRHGVDHAHFARALDLRTPPLFAGKRPVVGFIGLLAEWVDLELVGRVADAGATVVLVGDVRGADVSALRARKNVVLAGRRPYAELPGWCRSFDAAILPFKVNDLTVAANPLKLREYLAAGLPVIATDLPEARSLAAIADGLTVAADTNAFVRETLARAGAPDSGPRANRSRSVAGESWDGRVAELFNALRMIRAHTFGEEAVHVG
jgi:glycosyltransferase involved in cell wall biosynthesis